MHKISEMSLEEADLHLTALEERKGVLESRINNAYFDVTDGDIDFERCTDLFAELFIIEHIELPELTNRIYQLKD